MRHVDAPPPVHVTWLRPFDRVRFPPGRLLWWCEAVPCGVHEGVAPHQLIHSVRVKHQQRIPAVAHRPLEAALATTSYYETRLLRALTPPVVVHSLTRGLVGNGSLPPATVTLTSCQQSFYPSTTPSSSSCASLYYRH